MKDDKPDPIEAFLASKSGAPGCDPEPPKNLAPWEKDCRQIRVISIIVSVFGIIAIGLFGRWFGAMISGAMRFCGDAYLGFLWVLRPQEALKPWSR